jgi:hypothetical protein
MHFCLDIWWATENCETVKQRGLSLICTGSGEFSSYFMSPNYNTSPEMSSTANEKIFSFYQKTVDKC